MIRLRVVGRTLRPGCLVTRRFFLGTLGVECFRVPRSQNPFALARKIRRYLQQNEDLLFLKKLAVRSRKPVIPPPSPGVDLPEPTFDDEHVAAAE